MENNALNTENSVVTQNSKDEEISLIDLFAVLWQRKWLIIIMTGLGAVLSLVISILSLLLPPEKSFMPNKYTPKAQMLITEDSSSGASSMLGSLGGLASMAGVNVGGGATNSALAGYLVNSNTIQDNIIDRFNFIEEWEIEKSPKAESRKALKEKLKSNFDEDTGVFTISFEDKDPVLARDVVNFTVDLLEQRFNELGVDKNKLQKQNLEDNINNTYSGILDLQKQIRDIEYSVSNVYSAKGAPSIMMDTSMVKMELAVQEEIYKQLKSQYEMLKVTMASEKPVFQILEYAEIPDQKSGPSRGKLCIIITFAAGFLSVFLAFLLNALKNIKNDPDAVSKFKKEK
ncbi:MAG: Wzz/FepE/Etk N-terminal domain-containing protein [Treponema sp.]|nr:Wzz/FepE/Etk N-terminal domain-containing protein [Treponema sp.]